MLPEKENIFVLVLFIIVFFLIASLVKNKILRFIFSVMMGVFIIGQSTSLYFTQRFIDYQFYLHANLKGIQGLTGLFIPHSILSILLLFLLILFFYKSRYLVEHRFLTLRKPNIQPFKKITNLSFIAIGFFIILMRGTFISDSQSLVSLLLPSEKSNFKKVLRKHNMASYISPNQIRSEKGKNIIVISLESLEKAFLGGKFSDLTPNLQRLKNNWNYYDLNENHGSNWTSGSLYTCLTGFPAYFGTEGNEIFQNTYHSDVSGISHVLKKAGYQLTFMNGKAAYSGTDDMVNTFEFDTIIDITSLNGQKIPKSFYGLRDKDLFELAKKEVTRQSSLEGPFALFLSTTDTHQPDGIYDARMEQFITEKESNLEFMIAAVDYMVGDFISYLAENKMLSNTTVFIFPDHLKMGDPTIFEEERLRSLYVISNAEKSQLAIDSTQNLYQIDLPKIILNGSEVKHNVKFFTDYISGNKNDFIRSNGRLITEININGLLRNDADSVNLANILNASEISSNYNAYRKDTMRYIAHAGGKIDGLMYTNSKEALDLSYKKGFRLFELDLIETKDDKYVAAHDWKNWAQITNYQGPLPVTNQEFLKHKLHQKYAPLDMKGINKWFTEHEDAILVTDKVNDPIRFSKEFVDPKRLMMELFNMPKVKQGIKAGIKSAMPSNFILKNATKRDIKYFKKLGIKDIAISRRSILYNVEILEEFKANGINIYAFHVNHDYGYDEEYVVKYEMDHIFGIYADEWNFNN